MQLGQILKERGQSLVLFNSGNWKDEAISKLREYALYRKKYLNNDHFSMDQFKQWARKEGLAEPHHFNCWGALPKTGCKESIIEPVDGFAKSSDPSAHARKMSLWKAK